MPLDPVNGNMVYRCPKCGSPYCSWSGCSMEERFQPEEKPYSSRRSLFDEDPVDDSRWPFRRNR